MYVMGDNSILKKAQDAGYKTGRAEFIEKAKLEVTGKQIENLGNLTEGELTKILEKYGTLSSTGAESILDEIITSSDEKYKVKVREIWDGEFYKNMTDALCTVYDSYNFDGEKLITLRFEVGTTWKENADNFIQQLNKQLTNKQYTSWKLLEYDEQICFCFKRLQEDGGFDEGYDEVRNLSNGERINGNEIVQSNINYKICIAK